MSTKNNKTKNQTDKQQSTTNKSGLDSSNKRKRTYASNEEPQKKKVLTDASNRLRLSMVTRSQKKLILKYFLLTSLLFIYFSFISHNYIKNCLIEDKA